MPERDAEYRLDNGGSPEPADLEGFDEMRANPSRAGSQGSRGGSSGRGNQSGSEGGSSGGQGSSGSNPSRRAREQEFHSPQPSEPQSGASEQQEPAMGHQQQPTIIAGGAVPFGAPFTPFASPWGYGGYPGFPGQAPVTTVVSGGHNDNGHGLSAQVETVADIAIGNLRESASNSRFTGVSNQIQDIGDRIDRNAGFARELTLQKEFSNLNYRMGEQENRLLSAFKDSELRHLQETTGLLRAEVADSREARRFDDLRDSVRDLTRLIADRLPARA